jgi:FkbM family methyltransferase
MSDFVVFGAGKLGYKVARALHPVAFCDNNSKLWGTRIDGIPVEAPAEAVKRHPGATFIVAIWYPSSTESLLDRINAIKALGATRVLAFTELIPDFADQLLPHFLWARPDYYREHENEIAHCRALLDEAGKAEFDRQLRLRSGDLAGQVIHPEPQFFPAELALGQNEFFIDGGAYDGDTIAAFRQATGDQFDRVIAFEPDPVNLVPLREATAGDARITVKPFGLGARTQALRFTLAGTGSHIAENGDCEIQVVSLDEALGGAAPTYIKFDIEGSELDALEGGRHTITRHRPKLAVCVYHVPDHLWRVPLQLHELLPGARLTLRSYAHDGFECVCYCIPN